MSREILVALVAFALATATAAGAAETKPVKSLAECIAIAVENHPSLGAAAASVQAGQQRVWQAVSDYLPQLSAVYGANRRFTSASARTGTNVGTQSQTFNFFNTGVGFTQLLFDFGQNLDSIRAAQASEQSLRADATTQRETVVLDVKQSYFGLLAAQRLLAVAEETVRQNQQHLDLARGRFDVGLAAKFDVTQAQVQLANAELSRVTARNNVALGRAMLQNSLGVSTPLDFDIVDSLDYHEVHIGEEEALNAAYEKRPELLSIRAQERADSERVSALQKDYLPFVTGNGAYDWTGNDYPLQPSWNIGVNVNLSLFNGGLTTAQIGEAKADLSNLRFNEEGLKQNIALEVRQALLNLQQASESIDVSAKALEEARENRDLAENRYQTGVGSIIELTDAQTSFTVANANHVRALYDYRTALAEVEKATSETFTDE
jgi:outer membrane protein